MLQDGDGGVVEGEGKKELRKSWSTEMCVLLGGTASLDDIVRDSIIFM